MTVLWTFDGVLVRRVGAHRTRPSPNRLTALPAPRSALVVALVAALLVLVLALALAGLGLGGRLCVLPRARRSAPVRTQWLAGPLRRPTRPRRLRTGSSRQGRRARPRPARPPRSGCRDAPARGVAIGRRGPARPRPVERAAARRRPEVERSRPRAATAAAGSTRRLPDKRRDRDHGGHGVRVDRGAIGGQRVTQRHGVRVSVGRIGGHRLGDDRGQVRRDAVERRGRRLAGGKGAGRVRRRHRRHTR